MIIYIYGNKKFKKEINALLLKSDIKDNIENINSLSVLKSTIKEYPENIFLIDHQKIIDNNNLINKINFFKPKDGIEKEFLEKYGVGDICFNSMNGFVQYILSRLHKTTKLETKPLDEFNKNVDETNEEQYEFNNTIEPQEEEKPRDLANIICIDDIMDSEMVETMNDFQKKEK